MGDNFSPCKQGHIVKYFVISTTAIEIKSTHLFVFINYMKNHDVITVSIFFITGFDWPTKKSKQTPLNFGQLIHI